jgi:hypothetical protein
MEGKREKGKELRIEHYLSMKGTDNFPFPFPPFPFPLKNHQLSTYDRTSSSDLNTLTPSFSPGLFFHLSPT